MRPICCLVIFAGLLLSSCRDPQPERRAWVYNDKLTREALQRQGFPVLFPQDTGEDYRSSFIWTNLAPGSVIKDDIIIYPVPRAVYDVAMVRYSDALARRWHLDEKGVAAMSPGLHLMQLEMRTEGYYPRCYAKLLLDDDLEILGGIRRFDQTLRGGGLLDLPFGLRSLKQGITAFEIGGAQFSGRQEDIGIAYVSAYLSGQSHIPAKGKPGSRISSLIKKIDGELLEGFTYLELNVGCSTLPGRIYAKEGAQIWVRRTAKTGGAETEDDFHMFPIPEDMRRDYSALVKTNYETDADVDYELKHKVLNKH